MFVHFDHFLNECFNNAMIIITVIPLVTIIVIVHVHTVSLLHYDTTCDLIVLMLFCARQKRLCFKMQCSASLPVSVWMKLFIFQPHNKVLCYRACMLQFILYLSTQAGIRVT